MKSAGVRNQEKGQGKRHKEGSGISGVTAAPGGIPRRRYEAVGCADCGDSGAVAWSRSASWKGGRWEGEAAACAVGCPARGARAYPKGVCDAVDWAGVERWGEFAAGGGGGGDVEL